MSILQNILKRNNVHIIGEGETTLVFGHGLACDQKIWNTILPHFEEDYQIVLYDYVGSGNSDLSAFDQTRYSSMHGYAKDLLEILEAIEAEKVIFIGHSVSAMVGILASIERPDYFEDLILIGSSARYLNDEPNYLGGYDESDIEELITMMEMNFSGWATLAAASFMNNPDRPLLTEQLIEVYQEENPAMMKSFAEVVFLSDHRQDLPKVTVPSLIMQCSEDSIVPLESAEYLHNHLEKSELVVMEATGHYPQLSYPEETVRTILEYINPTASKE